MREVTPASVISLRSSYAGLYPQRSSDRIVLRLLLYACIHKRSGGLSEGYGDHLRFHMKRESDSNLFGNEF